MSPAEVEFVVFPNANHGRHQFNVARQLVDAGTETPGFRGMLAKLLIEPVAVHDVKVGLVGPILIQIFVGFSAVTVSMDWILVGAGSDLESEVKQTVRVVFLAFDFVGSRQGEERAG